MRTVCCWQVQECYRQCRMHTLPCQYLLDHGRGDEFGYVPCLPRQLGRALGQLGNHRLCVQCWIHGGQRRDVHGVQRGRVQAVVWVAGVYIVL